MWRACSAALCRAAPKNQAPAGAHTGRTLREHPATHTLCDCTRRWPAAVMMMFDGISVGSGSFAHLPRSNVAGLGVTLAALHGECRALAVAATAACCLPGGACGAVPAFLCSLLLILEPCPLLCSWAASRAGLGSRLVGARCLLLHPPAGPPAALLAMPGRRVCGRGRGAHCHGGKLMARPLAPAVMATAMLQHDNNTYLRH